MKFRWVILVLLAGSLLLNAATLGYLAKIGKLRQFLLKLDLVEHNPPRLDFQKGIETRYLKLPNTPAEIVFAGDSLVGDGPWSELFSEVHNRGVGGDTVGTLLDRLGEITEAKPKQIFLLLGANDLSMAVPEAQTVRHYRTLLERIRRESPETAVVVIGSIPINPTFPTSPVYSNAQVASLNAQIKGLIEREFPDVRFLDLKSFLSDDAGNLRREFSTDGLHLNLDAYLAMRKPIAESIKK